MKNSLKMLLSLTVVFLALGACKDDPEELDLAYSFTSDNLTRDVTFQLQKPVGVSSTSEYVLVGTSPALSLASIMETRHFVYQDIKRLCVEDVSCTVVSDTVYLGNYFQSVEFRLRHVGDSSYSSATIGRCLNVQHLSVSSQDWKISDDIKSYFSGNYVIDIYARLTQNCVDFSFPVNLGFRAYFDINSFE